MTYASTPLFEDLPKATLGAIVIAALIELVDIPALVRIYGVYSRRLIPTFGAAARADFIAAMAALFGVLLFDTLPGLFIGIGCSLLLLIYRASRPRVARLGRVPGRPSLYADLGRHPEFKAPAGVVVLRVEGALFFADAEHVRAALIDAATADGIRAVVLDAGSVPAIDLTAVEMLRQVREELTARRVQLLVAHDIGQVRDLLENEPSDRAWSYRNVEDAVRAAMGER
jgi:sulfate permease, SulP family